jgi:hypothetical protein
MHKLSIALPDALEATLAALGLVRQLPALSRLEVELCTGRNAPAPDDGHWPPFIPPSLKALSVVTRGDRLDRSLLHALSGMLGGSGARLERLEVYTRSGFMTEGDERLLHVAQALRRCSPTLREFHLTGDGYISIERSDDDEELAERGLRLNVQWYEVLMGVSACRQLEVLVLPGIEVETFFPPGAAFARLTRLEMSVHCRDHPPVAGLMGLWELMASGGLPALAKLNVMLEGGWDRGKELRSRVAPALEAVAGTLTHLHFEMADYNNEGLSYDEGVGYELGVAVGKLRRLKDLALALSRDGRVYHAVAQGLAASGGECPLPSLWRLEIASSVGSNADLLASLLLPTVRTFVSIHRTDQASILTSSALRQAGYKHIWAPVLHCSRTAFVTLQAIAQCRLDEANVYDNYPEFLVDPVDEILCSQDLSR